MKKAEKDKEGRRRGELVTGRSTDEVENKEGEKGGRRHVKRVTDDETKGSEMWSRRDER